MFDWGALIWDRPAVMGILNVTPDSFSDGGRHVDPDAALAHAAAMVEAGADIVDVGGESTRPGARPVALAEELTRVIPVVERVVRELGVVVSVDTMKAGVAAAALLAGAEIVNDVSAGTADPDMLATVAGASAGFVAMHMRGEPRTMQDDPRYEDVVREVGDFLAARLDTARGAGIGDAALCADPGIGFGKTVEHNLALLARLDELRARLGVPLLVGASRKRFIGTVLGATSIEGEPDALHRDDASLAAAVWAMEHGASVVRVHDVRPAVEARSLLTAMAVATA